MARGGLGTLLERSNWWQVRRVLDGGRARVAMLSLVSFVSGGAEAAFLVVLTRVGLAVADGATRTGVLNGWRLPVRSALALAALFLMVRLAASVIGAVLTTALTASVTARIRAQLAEAFLSAPWAVQQAEPVGRLQQLVSGVAGIAAGSANAIGNSIAAMLSLVAMLSLAVLVDPLGTALVMVTLVLLGAVLAPIRRRIKLRSRTAAAAAMSLGNTVAEVSSLGLEMHAFGISGEVGQRLAVSMDREVLTRRRANLLAAILPHVYISMAFGALLIGVWIATAVGVSELSSVGAVLLMMLRALSYGQQLQSASGSLAGTVPSLEQIDQALATYRVDAPAERTLQPALLTPIVCDDVSYSYDGDHFALEEVSLRIETGEIVGIIGPSGAGKSTLLQLLLGLRAPTVGSVTAGGSSVGAIVADRWHRGVAFVPQDAHLINGTVADNIRFFRKSISDDDVRRAASLAGLLRDIEALPDGFANDLGEQGSRLSGGQRQRLSIARALAGSPELLVLDEPTSALDIQSEAIVRETLTGLRGVVTVVVIAHRMSTLEPCDRLVVIENGRVSGFGTCEQLAATNDFYREAASAGS